jgi:hypothetical protein
MDSSFLSWGRKKNNKVLKQLKVEFDTNPRTPAIHIATHSLLPNPSHTHAHICMHTFIHTHTHLHTLTPTCTYTHVPLTHTMVHTHLHTHTHTHTHKRLTDNMTLGFLSVLKKGKLLSLL